MISTIGLWLMIIAGVGTFYYGFFLLMAVSAQAGAKLSKNGKNDEIVESRIEENKAFSQGLKAKVRNGLIALAVGALLYFGGGLFGK